MAAEYEIKEIGFVGSLWQGEFLSPINIGKTVEITNVLNTIEQMRRQSVFFSTNENFDLDKLNKQTPDSNFYYEIGKLSYSVLNDLSINTKIDKGFLEKQTVLFGYNKLISAKNEKNSVLRLQDNWSFNTLDIRNVKYIYSNEFVTVSYTFLVNEKYQKTLIDYFTTIQQEDGLPIVTPPDDLSTTNGSRRNDVLEFTDVSLPEEVRGYRPPQKFEEQPSDYEGEIVRQAEIRFQQELNQPIESKDELFLGTTIPEINENIRLVDLRTSAIKEFYQSSIQESADPNGTKKELDIGLVYLDLVKKYLIDSINRLRNLDSVRNIDVTSGGNNFYRTDNTSNEIDSEPIILTFPALTDEETGELVVNLPSEPDKKYLLDIAQTDIENDLDDFDELIGQIIEDLEVDEDNIYAFKKIARTTDYSLPIRKHKTVGLFKSSGEKISTFYTSSLLTTKQKKYYNSIFNEPINQKNSYHQFDLTYCHISGSGSSYLENGVDLYPAKSMYRKYMLECFGHTKGKFPFKNGINGDYFYAIQLNRDAYREKLDSGNFELALCELSASGTRMHPSSSRLFTLIDESSDTKQEVITSEGIQEYYYVTSGSLKDGIYNESTDNAWGVVFPKIGLIILDGVVLDQSCSFSTVTSSADGQNTNRLFLSISGAAVPTSFRPSSSFFARSVEDIITETYFCRVNDNEFNCSNNYTYVSGSEHLLQYNYFEKNPHSYITTIGLYNRKRELLAVGKLRRPVLKNEGKNYIFEVVLRTN